MQNLLTRGLLVSLGALLVVACVPPAPIVPQSPVATFVPGSTEEATVLATQDEVVARAVEDLAQRLDVASDEIEVREVRAVVWSDGSLGCPQPGVGATAAEEEGLLIILQSDNKVYHYHSGHAQEPFWCEPRNVIVPTPATPKSDEMVPPPGSEID